MRSEQFWTWFDSFAAPKLGASLTATRDTTFRKMFEHLDSFDRSVLVIETGCVEDPDNWTGNGCSTILFDKYIETHPGSKALSIELDAEKVKAAIQLCRNVHFYAGDSVEKLKIISRWSDPVDLLYLDASDHSWINETPSQVHHFNELKAILPKLHDKSLVVVDDTVMSTDDYPQSRIYGKGGLVAQYALEVAADLEFTGYQIGFTRINRPFASKNELDLSEVIERARIHVQEGRMIAADRLYRLVLNATPPPWNGHARIGRGEACANFARNAHEQKKFGVAIDWFRDALVADPLAVDYRMEMVRSMIQIGAMFAARREASIACDLEPDNARAWQTLGGVESDMIDDRACIEAYDKALELCMKGRDDLIALSDAMLNRAVVALDTADHDRVRKLADSIIKLKVHAGDGYHVLAMLEYRLANHEKAIELFEKAEELNCRNQPLMHWNKSLPMQSIGQLKEGWKEHAWGEKETTVNTIYIPQHRFNKPKWRGELAPATIHIHTEAGHGDNISMLRYFPFLIERGYKVHYECDPLLIDLARSNFPDVEIMPRALDYPGVVGLKPFDYHLPIGDLPHAFGTDIDTVPWDGPYLKADPKSSAEFAKKLSKLQWRKIGLCWSSGIRREMNIWMEKYGRMKSMDFGHLEPIVNISLPDHFISLQVGDGRNEMDDQIIDVLPEKPTWAETAALIDNLDLVITVDTGVAHLAGAMGKPTWLMAQRDCASWHFMCYRPGASWNEASPWYPSVRIFRQHEFNTPGYWVDVVNDVTQALKEADVEFRAAS